jgi:hypothetical protein
MTRASLQSFRRVVTIEWPKHAQDGGKEVLLRVARQGHAKIMNDAVLRSGAQPVWEAFANRPGNTNLDSVVLPGPIVYLYHYTTEVVEQAVLLLQRMSPVRSGLYAKSHTIWANGHRISQAPKRLVEEIIISNPVPYARKIEVGKTRSGRSFVIQVPNRIYERAAKILRAKYRNVAKIEFNYVRIPLYGPVRRDPDRWPAIIISPLSKL